MAASIAAVASGSDFNQTTRDFDLPDGISAGQRLLVFLCMDDAPGTGTLTLEDSGWTLLVDNEGLGHFGGVIGFRATIAEKIADGDETTITVSCSAAESVSYVAVRITDFDAAEAPAIAGPVTFGSGFDPPSLNPAGWDVEDTLWIAVEMNDAGFAFTTAGPSGYGNYTESHFAHNDGVALAIATKVNAAASEDPGAFTFSGSPDVGFYTLAIRPGTDGPSPLEFSVRLSGGAANDDPLLSIGGAESSELAGSDLFDNVTFNESQSGLVDYRLVYLHNDEVAGSGTGAVYVSQQVESGREIAVGAAVEDAGEEVEAVADDETAPAGVVFSAPETGGEGVDLGLIGPGDGKGVWLRRTTDPGTAADITNPYEVTFEVAPLEE